MRGTRHLSPACTPDRPSKAGPRTGAAGRTGAGQGLPALPGLSGLSGRRRRSWVVSALIGALGICAPLVPSAASAEPRAEVAGNLPQELRGRIIVAVGEVPEPAASAFEARRRAAFAAERATEVLRSEGYYAATVTPDVSDGEVPRAIITIDPGPRFTIRSPAISYDGPGPAQEVQQAALGALGLAPGAPGRAEDVLAAEGRAVRALQEAGHADAASQPRRVIVDHADRTVEPRFVMAAGPLVRLGSIRVEGTSRLQPGWIETVVPWQPGTVYSREQLADFERMMLETGAFDSVTVSLAPATTADGSREVQVLLADRPRFTLEAELAWSSSEGFGVEGQLVRANLLGRADTWRIGARAAQIEQRLDTELRLPHWRFPRQTLSLGASAFRDDTDAFRQTGVRIRADITRRWGLTSFVTVGVSSDYATNREPSFLDPALGIARDVTAVSVYGAGLWDNADDPLDPTRGWKAEARLEPTWLTGDAELAFVRVTVQGSVYQSVGGDEARTVIAARGRIASLVGGAIPEIPSARRLYAGGGGSVRGYEFQGIGPRYTDPDRTPVGGLSLVEASIEVRHRLDAFGGRFGLVAFVDAGTLGLDPTPTFDGMRGGVGFGVRYDLGFAPLRFDVAFPLDDQLGGESFQLYLGVGQSF